MSKALIVSIFANASQFEHELNKAAGKTRVLSKAAGVAGLAIAGGLAFGLELSVKAAAAAQVSQGRLDAAYKASGLSAGKYAWALDRAESSGRNLGFTNTEVKDSMGSLIVATHNQRKAVQDLATAENVARFKHLGLADASKLVTSAMAGSSRAARQLGLQVQSSTVQADAARAAYARAQTSLAAHWAGMGKLTAAETAQEAAQKLSLSTTWKAIIAHKKFADHQVTGAKVVTLLNTKLHGQRKAFADSAAGGAAKFHAQMENLGEVLGKALLPILTRLANILATVFAWLGKHATVAKILVGAIALLAAGMMVWNVASSIAAATSAVLAVSMWAVVLPVLAVVAAVAVLALAAYEIYTHWGAISKFFSGVWGDIKRIFWDAVHWVENNWQYFLGLPGLVYKNWGAISGFFSQLWGGIKSVFFTVVDAIKGAFVAIYNFVTGQINHLINAYNAAFGWLTGNIPAIQKIGEQTGSAFGQAVVGATNAALAGAQFSAVVKVGAVGPSMPSGKHSGYVIPKHALGGIATRATAGIFGERGPEAIIPLSRPALKKYGLGGDSGGRGDIYTTANFYLDSRLVSREVRREALADAARGNNWDG